MDNHHSKRQHSAHQPRSTNGRSGARVSSRRATTIVDAVGQAAEEHLEAASEAVGKYVEQGRDEVNKLGRRLEKQIANRPWQILFAAVGLGVLAGLLIRRR